MVRGHYARGRLWADFIGLGLCLGRFRSKERREKTCGEDEGAVANWNPSHVIDRGCGSCGMGPYFHHRVKPVLRAVLLSRRLR